jgi:ankyrin repeat protein
VTARAQADLVQVVELLATRRDVSRGMFLGRPCAPLITAMQRGADKAVKALLRHNADANDLNAAPLRAG